MTTANPTLAESFKANWRQYIIYIGFAVIFVIFALTLADKGFLNPNNLLNIVRQTAMIAVMAIAMTFVLSAGEIDLSVGAVAGLATVTVAMAIAVAGPVAGVFAGLATGIAVGMFNGWLTTRVGIPSFLTTLAMMGIAKGVAMWISNTAAVPILSPGYSWLFGGGSLFKVPVLLFWMVIFGAIGHVVLRRTSFGRRVLATGGGETAARYSGIDTKAIKFRVLVISSTAAAFAGMLYAGRLQSGRFQLGEGGRTVCDRCRRSWRHQPVRRQGHDHRHHRRSPDDRHDQQRPDPNGAGILAATHSTRRNHHPRRCPVAEAELSHVPCNDYRYCHREARNARGVANAPRGPGGTDARRTRLHQL